MKVQVEYKPENGKASLVWETELTGVPRRGDYLRLAPQNFSQQGMLEDGEETFLFYVLAVVWTPRGELPADLLLAVDLASKVASRGDN